ncbi:P-loop containing nucleoside triphosphate hydrolase protein, partial [Mycena capillaripes]
DQWDITILGDHAVGRTSLAVRFSMDCFVDSVIWQTFDPTLEDSYRKRLPVDDRMSFVNVIDAVGLAEFEPKREQWVREGQAYLLVYSITSRETFDRLQVHRQTVERVKGEDAIILLVANKCDLDDAHRQVSQEEGEAFARGFGWEFIETSAKTGQNVGLAFSTLVRALRGPAVPAETKSKRTKCRPSCIIL